MLPNVSVVLVKRKLQIHDAFSVRVSCFFLLALLPFTGMTSLKQVKGTRNRKDVFIFAG